MASLPLSALLMKVNAAEGEIIDFQGEDAGDIVAGNDHFTIGGQDNADKEYFYVSNATEDTITLTVEGLQLQAGKKYNLSLDLYGLGITKDADERAFSIKVYGGSEASVEGIISKSGISIEEWTSYNISFTAKEGSTKLDFAAFTSSSAIIEDFVIISEDGQKVALDLEGACGAYSGAGTYAYGTLAELTGASMQPTGPAFNGDPDYAIYFDNTSSNTFWLTGLGMQGLSLPVGNTYKVEFDLYALTLGYRVVFNGVKAHFNTSHAIPNGGQVWNEAPTELNKWQHYSFDITTTDNLAGIYFHVLSESGVFKGYLDNFKVKDTSGNVIFSFDIDETCLDNTSNGAKVVSLPKEIVALTYPAYKMTMDKGEFFRATNNAASSSYGFSFDYYLSKGSVVVDLQDNPNGSHKKTIEAGVGSYTDTVSRSDKSFTITAADSDAVLYIWNVKVLNDGKEVAFGNYAARTTCEFEEIVFADIPGAHYGEVDNSGNGGNSGSAVDLTAPAYKMTYDSGEAFRTSYDKSKANKATIKFDYYLKSGRIKVYGSNNESEAGYLQAGVNSFELSANSPSFWIAERDGADELYIWNVELTQDGSPMEFKSYEGRTTCEFEKITVGDVPDIGDLGNSGSTGSTTPVQPAADNYIMLIDTTKVADNGTANQNFWFNELGMPGYGGKLESGKTYTLSFDVYPIQMPTSNNLFHYRTSNGSASSNAGWWKPEFELNKWQNTTHTFKVEDASKSGNHILYVYGGFKGYIDNFKLLDENGNVVEGTFTDFTGLEIKKEDYKNYLSIEKEKTGSALTPVQPAADNYIMLIDTTNVADNGTANQCFWFNELGMPLYRGKLEAGKTYTVSFDVYPIQMPTSNNLFHYRTDSGSGSTHGKFWKPDLELNKWQTTTSTITITDASKAGIHRLFVYGGFKGYIDNFKLLDENGNVVEGTFTDFTGLEIKKEDYKNYLSIEKEKTGPTNLSGLEIAILKGKAGKDGASITLGGAKSPLTVESNKTYKLIFRYYQANPTNSGELNLFGVKFIESVLGKSNDVTWFKKNSTEGWTEVKILFSTGNITNTGEDWFQLVLNPNAWVFFDDFTLEETEVDNNKSVSKITFDQKDDSIYPYHKSAECVFEQSSEKGGTFKVVNATEYTNASKNSNQYYTFTNIKVKPNTTYKISIDYYNEAPFEDYAAAFGYNAKNLGNGSGDTWPCFINNVKTSGWHTATYTITTGEVVPNANYFKMVFYDVNNSSEPRVMYFDNFTITEQYKVETSLNDKTLGTVTKSFSAQAGDNVRVVANAFEGATFEGWYEYGDLVSTDKTYRINNLNDNHKLEAKFSGKAKPGTVITQGFEDYELGDIGFEYYEIVDDSKNVLEGNKALHVKPGKITESIETSIFFPVVSDKNYQMKDDYTYDVYVWIKPVNPAESVHYYAFLGSNNRDQSDMLVSGEYAYISISNNIKPQKATALEENNGWYKYLLGTVTKDHTDRDGFAFQICKYHANRNEGASIDDIYIDRVEVVERTPDFENLKYTEKFFNEVANPNFEEEITDENWGPLTDGVTVEEIADKEYDWQGKYNLKFDAAASNGQEYVNIIPISKTGKNYTFAAWTKLSKGSDITVGLYSNGEYVPFDDVMNGETGKLKLIDNEKWNRVNFSFNSGDSKNAYLVIKGTKGTLELDMVNIFIAERGFKEDPNTYGDYKTAFQETDPIAFPDKITTEEVLVEEGQEATNNKKYLITKEWVGPNVLVIVLSIVGGVLAAAAIAIVLIIVLAKKRKKN